MFPVRGLFTASTGLPAELYPHITGNPWFYWDSVVLIKLSFPRVEGSSHAVAGAPSWAIPPYNRKPLNLKDFRAFWLNCCFPTSRGITFVCWRSQLSYTPMCGEFAYKQICCYVQLSYRWSHGYIRLEGPFCGDVPYRTRAILPWELWVVNIFFIIFWKIFKKPYL